MRRLLSWVFFGIAIAVGCGGRLNPDDGTGSGGSGGAAGGTTGTGGGTTGTGGGTTGTGGGTTGTGGTTVGGTTVGGTGGTTSVGGTGGTTVGGTTSGGTGAKGGTGGTGGSGGTGGDPGTDWTACTGPGQCELVSRTCCNCEILGLDRLNAINSAARKAHTEKICGGMGPCPPCEGGIAPYLMARCESGRCQGFDVRSDPTYTKCGSDQECTLRKGLGCCVCQAPGDWVALSRVGEMLLSAQVCAPGTACPGCVPVPPANTLAVCTAGVCVKNVILR